MLVFFEKFEKESQKGNERQQIDDLRALTTLRFFAAFFIVLHHLRGSFGIAQEFATIPLGSGVSFFFVLSGFILNHVYRRLDSRQETGRFLFARVAKLMPLHLITLGLTAIFVGDFTGIQTQFGYVVRFVANALLIQAWYPDFRSIFSFNSVSWSISVELFFYLMFPILLFGFSKNGWWKLVLSFALVVWVVILCSDFQLPPYKSASEGGLTRTALLYISPVTRLFEFVLGMYAYSLWKTVKGRVDHLMLWTALEAAAFLAMAVYLYEFHSIHHQVFLLGGSYAAEWFGQSGVSVPAAILIIGFASGKGAFGRLLSVRGLVFLGHISFAMYMCHQMILRYILVKTNWTEHFSNPQMIGLYLSIVFVVSVVLWQLEIRIKPALMKAYDVRTGSPHMSKSHLCNLESTLVSLQQCPDPREADWHKEDISTVT